MKKAIIVMLALSLVALTGTGAMATNGYQLIGVGQIQKSMGGAVTAAPRDAMTAITNPAGIARIGSRADFSLEAFMPTRSVDFSATGGSKTEGGSDMYGIPAIGWAAPTSVEGMYFGGGMYGTSGLGVDYGQIAMNPVVDFDGHSSIMFWKMAPTLAIDLDDKTSLGFSLNIDYQSVALTQKFSGIGIDGIPILPIVGAGMGLDLGRPTSQFGIGFTLGGLYDVNDMVTVGAMYSSKQSFSEAEFRVGANDVVNYNGAMGLAGTYKMGLEYPSQYAIGVAVKPIDNLMVTFDYKVINWSETHDKVSFSGPANSFMVAPATFVSSTQLDFGWEDQTIIALGLVYTVNDDLAISAGYNQADAPIDEADVFNNLVLPATVETHYTLGFDYNLGAHWGVGMTYMKAKSAELVGTGDIPAAMVPYFTADSNTVISLEEDSYGMQLSYRF